MLMLSHNKLCRHHSLIQHSSIQPERGLESTTRSQGFSYVIRCQFRVKPLMWLSLFKNGLMCCIGWQRTGEDAQGVSFSQDWSIQFKQANSNRDKKWFSEQTFEHTFCPKPTVQTSLSLRINELSISNNN